MDEHKEIDRTESIVDRIKQRLLLLQDQISKIRELPIGYTDPLRKAQEDLAVICSLFSNEPANGYGVSLEQMLVLAESQIKTAKDNTELRETNQALRQYVVGLEQRLKDANDEAIRLFQKREYKQP